MFQVELSKCRWTVQSIDPTHIFPNPSQELTEGPILVSYMNDKNYFVHDGRHRCIRALLRGELIIDAEWLEDHDADREAERIKKKIALTLEGEPINQRSMTMHTEVVGGPIPHLRSYPSYTDRSDLPPYDAVVLNNGEVKYSKWVWRATCGREHVHEAHYCGEHMEEYCDGVPTRRIGR